MSTSSTSASGNNFFNGQSNFSAQLNNSVSRSVAIATLPITELQNQQSTLTNEQGEIQTLGNDFVAVQSAIDSINTAAKANTLSASLSVSTVANATVSAGALSGNYSLNITSLGSQTSAISAAGTSAVTDPSTGSISSATSFTLVSNGTNYTITPSGTSLDSLVSAINASGAKVQATVVNVGGSANPDYRLSVQSSQYGPGSIALNAGSTSLLTSLNSGTYVTYQVNGQPSTPINSTSRTLSISTGLTATALTTGSTDISVSQNSSSLSNAISAFATAYNAASAELTKNRGQGGGALTGDSLIQQLQSSLNSIGSYRAGTSGSVQSLADIGLTFDQSGNLSFDSGTFDAAYSASPSAVTSFLGAEAGGGFIQSAYSTLTSLTDSTSGTITAAGNNVGASITSLTDEISTKQAQVTQLQTNLTTEMSQADAAISSLEGQLTEITGLFSAENQVSQNINGVG